MKRINWPVFALALATIVATSGFMWTSVRAQTNDKGIPEPSEARLRAISTGCSLIKARLSSAQKTDLEARIKRGRAYDQELIPYVTAFNSRVAANQVDAPELISAAAALRLAVSQAEFARLYSVYADQINEATRSDCERNPRLTYYAIEQAKLDRKALAAQVQKIDSLISEYIDGLRVIGERIKPVINRPGGTNE